MSNRELEQEVTIAEFVSWVGDKLYEMQQTPVLHWKRSLKMWISLFLIWVGYDECQEEYDE